MSSDLRSSTRVLILPEHFPTYSVLKIAAWHEEIRLIIIKFSRSINAIRGVVDTLYSNYLLPWQTSDTDLEF